MARSCDRRVHANGSLSGPTTPAGGWNGSVPCCSTSSTERLEASSKRRSSRSSGITACPSRDSVTGWHKSWWRCSKTCWRRQSCARFADGRSSKFAQVGCTKAAVAKRFVDLCGPAEFQMAVGDDRTDEDMFEALDPSAWTVRVGSARSRARFTVPGPEDVLAILGSMTDQLAL